MNRLLQSVNQSHCISTCKGCFQPAHNCPEELDTHTTYFYYTFFLLIILERTSITMLYFAPFAPGTGHTWYNNRWCLDIWSFVRSRLGAEKVRFPQICIRPSPRTSLRDYSGGEAACTRPRQTSSEGVSLHTPPSDLRRGGWITDPTSGLLPMGPVRWARMAPASLRFTDATFGPAGR